MYTWGRGASGQLGHGTTGEERAPKKLELLDAILAEGPLKYAARNIVTPAANTIDNRCAHVAASTPHDVRTDGLR